VVDNCAHQLVKKPEQFEVIVTTNMNGDILSDLTSALIGGLGFAPSANIGHEISIFEAVHGSAPKYAGRDSANPTAMILSAVMMLRHIGEFEAAGKIEDAVVYTLAEGKTLTRDVVGEERAAGTRAYTDEIIRNLGQRRPEWKSRPYSKIAVPKSVAESEPASAAPRQRHVIGVDVFIEADTTPAELGAKLTSFAENTGFKLKMISNRGTQVYPARDAATDCVDHWRCRFLQRHPNGELPLGDLNALLGKVEQANLRWMHLEKLQEFDGKPAYTKAQGED
jgi:isocitrate dehydrogenase